MNTYTFHAQYYRDKYKDLAHLDEEEARKHYFEVGIVEGRVGGKGGLREELLECIPEHGLVLEIGPFAGPALRGSHVRYADVLSTADLRKRAEECGIDPAGCPEIDYVLADFDLSKIPDRFMAVFSSHCIEHQPDLVRHLQAVDELLKTAGRYFLIIPDKRYCFDHFIAESTIADVVTAYVRRRKVHEVGSIIEHWALTTHNDIDRHWNGDHGCMRIAESTELLERALREYEADPERYIDVHAWQFTPLAFLEVMRLLNELGLTMLQVREVHSTARGRNEFCAVLEKIT